VSFLHFIGLVGATIIFVWSPLFKWIRKLSPTFFECPMCIGFWVGLAGSAVVQPAAPYFDHFLIGCAVGLVSFAIHLPLHLLDVLISKSQ
jgi:hypothetical protein